MSIKSMSFTIVPVLSGLAIALSACTSSADEAATTPAEQSPEQESTVTSTKPVETVTETANPVEPTTGAPANTGDNNEGADGENPYADMPLAESLHEQMRPGLDIGAPVYIRGQETETCIFGDGFGINLVSAGANTSCDFANATFHALTDGGNATEDSLRDQLPTTVSATSPVTGQNYEMSCTVDDEKLVKCTGGDNAEIFMY